MKIEILYPELGNLYGDSANVRYLRQCLPEAEFTETHLPDEPLFARSGADFVYCGPMTERGQQLAAQALLPYAEAFSQCIDDGVRFLFTGNSMELTGKRIETDEGDITAMGALDFYSKRFMKNRCNSLFLGFYEDIKITAFNSRFSHCYPGDGVDGFAHVVRGIGLNKDCSFEGVRKNNFIGTYLLGPLLVLNPLFTQRILGVTPAHFDVSMAAYEKRLREFENPKTKLD